jgi:predicted O-methyltransferase YrrM
MVAALCLAVGAAVAGWLGRQDVAVAILALLAAASLALLLDIRHRQQVHGRKLTADAVKLAGVGRNVADLHRHSQSVETSIKALSARVKAASNDASRRAARTSNQLRSLEYEPVVDAQAVLQLLALVSPRAAMPALGGWAMDARTQLELGYLLLHDRPKLAVELGSGASTIWSGYLMQSYGGRLVSFDHEPKYAALTADAVRRHGLDDVVELRHAPLEPMEIGDRGYLWYELAAFDDLDGIDLLVVDGPPDSLGLQARMPAFWMLQKHLADGALVILDDTIRAGEQAIVTAWTAEKGLSVVRDLNGRATLLEYRA